MDSVLIQLAIILSISSVLGIVVSKLKVPLIVSYLLAGVVLSAFKFFNPEASFILNSLPEIGIALVLFLIGMELDLKEIKSLGLPIAVVAIGQIIVTSVLGFEVATLLGFAFKESIFIGLGLAFSSTIVVVKLLMEKNDLSSLYGKLSLGISLVEDLVAVAVLMVISVGTSALNLGFQQSLPLLMLVLKGIGLFLLTFLLSRYFLPRIFELVAKSTEQLFFTSITWCFLFTTITVLAGFSIEIGAFLAGIALASSPYHFQIQGKIKPLRDFFITLFFIYIGSQVVVGDLLTEIPAILIFSVLTMILKPLVYMILLSFFGFRKHTLYQTSLNLSMLSEFSLIVIVIGANYGLVGSSAISVIAAVAVVSIIFSSILIYNSRKLYKFFLPFVRLIERSGKYHIFEERKESGVGDHVIIVGAHRIGKPVAEYLKRENIPFVIMDFNPHIVKELDQEGMNVVYGDIGDPEVLESLHFENTRLVISTAPSLEDNEILISEIKRRKSDAKIVVRAEDKEHGEVLKKLGAHYIVLPERVSGAFLVNQIKRHWPKIVFTGLN